MLDIKDQLNNIPFETVLGRLGIKTFPKGLNTRGLYDGNKKSDGWILAEKENLINDFSGKRAKGDVVGFLGEHLNLNFKEVLEYGKNTFGLIDMSIKKELHTEAPKQENNTQFDIRSKFNLLEGLGDSQIKYLEGRGINFEKVKDVVKQNKGGIACMIFDEKGKAISINTRSTSDKRFYIEAGTKSKGVYMGDIDKTNKKVYVVEGMFDFLSLRQFTKNVIGLKSVNDGIEVVKEFYKKGYEITIIPDNDEAGRKVLQYFSDIRYYSFDLRGYDVKDVNDVLVNFGIQEGILDTIDRDKVYSYKDDIQQTTKPFTWGTELSDNVISPIERNHYIIFGGSQGQGKTTFTFDVADKNAALGHKVLYLSLEMDTEKLKTNMARSYAGITKQEWRIKNIPAVKEKAYYKRKSQIQEKENLILRGFKAGEAANTEAIQNIILEVRPDLVFIDNFDLISGDSKDKLEKQEDISKFFLEFTNTYNIPCVLLHHMSKGGTGINGLRGSGKITDDADLVISGGRKENAGNKEEEKMFIINELKSRDWGTFNTHIFLFEKGTFKD